MHAAIQTQGLTRRFHGRTVVDQLSMTVPSGSVYGFLGRNGAGKTTTLKLLLGLLRPDAGQIRIQGLDLASQRQVAARQMGALLEAHGFYAHLSGRGNLDLARRLLGLPAREIDRVLELTEMREHGQRRVADYSLGMRQRLGLARALLGSPPVLLLDEPTNGLDPEGIADMRRFLRALPERGATTVLVSSHLLSEIEQVATHVGILSLGRLVKEGELAALVAGQGEQIRIETTAPTEAAGIARTQGLAATVEDAALLVQLPVAADAREAGARLNRALCLAGVPVHALVPRRQSLEQLYQHLAQPNAA